MNFAAASYPFVNAAVDSFEVLYVAPSWTLVFVR